MAAAEAAAGIEACNNQGAREREKFHHAHAREGISGARGICAVRCSSSLGWDIRFSGSNRPSVYIMNYLLCTALILRNRSNQKKKIVNVIFPPIGASP